MTRQLDMRFLIGVLIFGIVGTATGFRWLSSGFINVRGGELRSGVGGKLPPPSPQAGARVTGAINAGDAVFYPVCFSWIGLGIAMVTLAVLSFFSSIGVFLKLAAYSCLGFLLLSFGTLAAALWLGS